MAAAAEAAASGEKGGTCVSRPRADLKGAAAASRSWHHGLHPERRGQGGGGAE